MIFSKSEISTTIKKVASEHGFAFCGISKAEQLEEEAKKLEAWLNQNKHGKMHYMENYFDKRIDPCKLVPEAKTVISLMYNYYTDKKQSDASAPKISMYAYGIDYHEVIKFKLKILVEVLQEYFGNFCTRIFVDSAPVLEKAWAKKSGLGWQGKNTNLIHPKAGSFFFLAEIICDLEMQYDHPIKDYCGTCTACIDACPTDALSSYQIDATKCISYLTIELKDKFIPENFSGKMENWVFGCDVCQTVCPWNRFAKQHEEKSFLPHPDFMNKSTESWYEITEDIFNQLFEKSAVKRTKFEGLKRNLQFIQSKKN